MYQLFIGIVAILSIDLAVGAGLDRLEIDKNARGESITLPHEHQWVSITEGTWSPVAATVSDGNKGENHSEGECMAVTKAKNQAITCRGPKNYPFAGATYIEKSFATWVCERPCPAAAPVRIKAIETAEGEDCSIPGNRIGEASYWGFAEGKKKYFVLTEIDGSAEKLSGSKMGDRAKLKMLYEYQLGSRTYSDSNRYFSNIPSNCSAIRDSHGYWLRVDCGIDDTSPMSDASYVAAKGRAQKMQGLALNCVRGCRPNLPSRLNRQVSECEG